MSRLKLGVSFFISQIVINPEKIVPFININLLPCKVYVTIIPITSVKTLEMINWLGVNIDNFNLDNYPNELIKIKFENICFESISYIHSSNFIEFVRLFS
jgi:5,10-methylenetetrahydrofolate reductase